MGGLLHWDDLVHGTLVFGAFLPGLLAALCAWKFPMRLWWAGAALALAPSFLWLFSFPALPPTSSEDVAVSGLVLGAAVLMLNLRLYWPVCLALGLLFTTALAMAVYPAWLAVDGDWGRRWLICGSLAASVTLALALARLACQGSRKNRWRIPLSAFMPPAVGLAILLQLGGAGRFGQAAAALAAAIAGFSLILVWRKREERPAALAGLWGYLFALFIWSGWLFAELRYDLALLLYFAPLASLLTRAAPLPRHHLALEHLWDGLAAALVTAVPVVIALNEYLAASGASEGY